jgi:PAS domain S-box-containing protein
MLALMLALMAGYEALKQSLLPHLTLGQSYAIAVIFCALAATGIAHLIFRRRQMLLGRTNPESAGLQLTNEQSRDSEETLRAVFDYAPDPFYLCTMTGEFVDGNRAAERITGYQRQELIGKGFLKLKLLSAADVLRAAGLLARNLVGQATGPDEFVLRRKDGTAVTLDISTRPVRVKGQALVLGIARDITERKRAEERERQRLQQLTILSQSAMEFVQLEPATDVYQLIARRLHEITGARLVCVSSFDAASDTYQLRAFEGLGSRLESAMGILGRHPVGMLLSLTPEQKALYAAEKLTRIPGRLSELSLSNIPARVMRGFESLLNLGSVHAMAVYRYGVMFGTATVIMKKGEELRDPGVVDTFVNQAAVALQRRLAEEALVESEAKYRELFEGTSDLIQSVAPDGHLLYVNRAWRDVLGYSEAEIARLSPSDVISPDDLAHGTELFRRGMAGEKLGRVEMTYVAKDGRRITVEGNVNVRFKDGKPVQTQAIFRDITERKQAEAQLVAKNTELAALNEQKNQFVGMAAHDLRNPLAVLLNYTEFLLSGATGELTADQSRFIATMKRSSDFMLRLINDLLDVSKIESGRVQLELQPVNLAELVAQNLTLNRLLAKRKGVELRFESSGNLPQLPLDPAKIEQVMNNLITNAVKFSNPGTQVKVGLTRENGHVRISVSDQGPGIPADELDKLFTPFARTSVKSTGGEKDTGLGLVIVKRIVEGHGGTITIDSEVGRGTTFTVTLPASGASS